MTVFANALEISAKAQGCKIVAAFPDTCFTPPTAPPTPPGVPLPYPNFAVDSDLASGTGTVKIGGKEVSQENKSKWSKVSGDEAGSAPKKGIVTSKNMGKAYAQKWSMDVKFEDKGVVRFTDMATTNHMSNTGNDAPWILVGTPAGPGFINTEDCLVGQYEQIVEECNKRGGEAHHIIPDEYLRTTSRGVAEAAAVAAKAGAADTSRSDDSLPSINQGCAICVGGNASGKMTSERTSAAGTKIAQKGAAYASSLTKKFLGYNMSRGHGFAHFCFDSLFKGPAQPIGYAVSLAKFGMAQLAAFSQSSVDADCAAVACDCIDEQFKTAQAKDPQPKVGRSGRDSPALDERLDTAGVDRQAITASWAQTASSLGYV